MGVCSVFEFSRGNRTTFGGSGRDGFSGVKILSGRDWDGLGQKVLELGARGLRVKQEKLTDLPNSHARRHLPSAKTMEEKGRYVPLL